jgi:hypothetical protein
MGSRSMTVGRYEEIQRRLAEGRGMREIARALNCSRDTVREVRDGSRHSPDSLKRSSDPLWMLQLEWPAIVHDLGLGHPLKFIWEEKAQHLTTYSNFWKHYLQGIFIYRGTADPLIFGYSRPSLVHIKRTRSRRSDGKCETRARFVGHRNHGV